MASITLVNNKYAVGDTVSIYLASQRNRSDPNLGAPSGSTVPTLRGASVGNAAVAGLLTSPILCGNTADTGLTAHPAVAATMGAVTAGANLPLVVLG